MLQLLIFIVYFMCLMELPIPTSLIDQSLCPSRPSPLRGPAPPLHKNGRADSGRPCCACRKREGRRPFWEGRRLLSSPPVNGRGGGPPFSHARVVPEHIVLGSHVGSAPKRTAADADCLSQT